MSTRGKLICAAVALVLFGIFVAGVIREHDLRVHAEATAAADEKIAAAAQANIAARDTAQAKVDASAVQQQAAVQTPQQAVRIIVSSLPTPPAAPGQPAAAAPQIPIVQTKDLPAAVQAQLPNAPSQVGIVTPDELQSIARQQISCKATASDLTTCKADKGDLQMEVKTQTDRANTWEAAAKGGTKFHRFLGVVKQTACSSAAASAATFVDKSHPARAAALGAAGGSVACSLF